MTAEPNICSNCRSVEMRVISRFAAGTVDISFSAALRGISTTIAPEAARTVAPRRRPEIRPTSPTIEPCAIGTVIAGLAGSTSTTHRAVGDREQRGAGLVALEDDVAGAVGDRVGIEHELAHLQHRHLVEDRDAAAQESEPFLDAAPARQGGELLLQDRLVGGLQLGIAVDELDDVIALVHAMLDQRIAGERADHVDAGHGGFEGRREHRIGDAVRARELDAGAGLDRLLALLLLEVAQQASTKARGGAEPIRAMTRSHSTFSSPSRVSKVIQPFSILLAVVSRRMVIRPSRLGRDQRLDVGVLGGGELGRAVDDGDDVALLGIGGEAERILDAGVAGADHDDMLVDIFAGIVELILDDARRRRPGSGPGSDCPGCRCARITVSAVIVSPALVVEREIALLAGDRGDLGVELDVDLVAGGLLVPGAEHLLALAGLEIAGPSAARAGSASP